MLKRTFLLLITLVMLAGVLPTSAIALTSEEQYGAALEQLQKYMNNDTHTPLDVIISNFNELGWYKMSSQFTYYAMVLQGIEKENYSRVFQLIDMLKMDKDFCAFLEEDGSFGTLDELNCYAQGRRAEMNGKLTDAMACYSQCMSFMDSMKRWYALTVDIQESKYQEALACFHQDTYAGYLKAYELFVELGDYKQSSAYAAKADMLRELSEPASTPIPMVTPTPTPQSKPTPVQTGVRIDNCTINVFADGTCEITTFHNWVGTKKLVIPAYVGGYPVVGIAMERNNRWETNSNVLERISIPEGIQYLGSYAFANCTKLKSIQIPNTVKVIDRGAFRNCTLLNSITLSENVTKICEGAFYCCDSLLDITISPDNPCYYIFDNALMSYDGTLVQYIKRRDRGSVTVSENVTRIGEGAFSGCYSATSITLPNSVISIGDSAFYKCRKLVNISIPNSVTTIEAHAFTKCDSLTSVTIPSSVQSIGKDCFEDTPCTLRVYRNSYAHQWAKDNNQAYTLID